MGRLDGKDVLITGGTLGIGFASAKLFRDEGARVAITGRSEANLAKAKTALGEDVVTIRADAGKVGDIEAMAETVKDAFGGLDGLFVNAGISRIKPYREMDEATFDEIMNVNVKGAWFTISRCAPFMRRGGSVVITTSTAHMKGQRNIGVYAASKAAARSMARSFSAELLDDGIRVTALSPGPTRTPIFESMVEPDKYDDLIDYMASSVPIKRLAEPEELARAALFLISDDSSFMLGADLVVDGGKSQL